MASGRYEFQSDFVKKYVAIGREEGRIEQAAKAVLIVLNARGLVPDDATRARIQACKDLPALRHWLRRTVTVGSVEELFRDD